MASKKGSLLICDRCGNTAFLPLTGKDYFDGGYSSADKFEPYPKGWTHICIGVYSDLCPECSKEWEKTRAAFFNRVLAEEETDG